MTFEFFQLGLASILGQNRLIVPPNQRDYSWTNREVSRLLKDFSRAIADRDEKYFLGTIVTIPEEKGTLEVVDGQQRLATTAIMLAEIRNYLSNRESIISESIDTEFLVAIDRRDRERIPRLRLNVDDNIYFRARLTNVSPQPSPERKSHKLIDEAFSEARAQISRIVSPYDEKDHGDILNDWIDFLENRAVAVLLRVSSGADAYRMFETLNDRGLRTSQSDLVKNYLFGKSGNRFEEVQQQWSLMRGALESIGEDDDITIRFLHHALTLIRGFVRRNRVYEVVERHSNAPGSVVRFTSELKSLSQSYVSTYNSDHEKWNETDGGKKAIEVLNLFDIKPLRPLILALTQCFDTRAIDDGLEFCISLAVRLMVASSTRTGTVQEGLAGAAHRVYLGNIAEVEDLKEDLNDITPSDERFRVAFETATVSNRKLARYYLRSMELTVNAEEQPWHIPNDDRGVITLEHILPYRPQNNWPHFTPEEVKIFWKRIGNMCLLRAGDNSAAKSAEFSDKRRYYRESPYRLTSEMAERETWRISEISERQRSLAAIAVETWKI